MSKLFIRSLAQISFRVPHKRYVNLHPLLFCTDFVIKIERFCEEGSTRFLRFFALPKKTMVLNT
jgi:hypothetical protein